MMSIELSDKEIVRRAFDTPLSMQALILYMLMEKGAPVKPAQGKKFTIWTQHEIDEETDIEFTQGYNYVEWWREYDKYCWRFSRIIK